MGIAGIALASLAGTLTTLSAQDCLPLSIGPPAGAIMLAGGGELDPAVYERFVDLAGGSEARILVVPTASRSDRFTNDWRGLTPFFDAGASDVRMLHTRDPGTADSDRFAEEIRRATGVWFMGGRPWRLVDAYQGTLAEVEFLLLLARGGVVGGTSAGASVLASYLVRGAPDDNDILMATGYESGFGFLWQTAVDQHLEARGREKDLFRVLQRHPSLLGIGLDEGTAIVVRADEAEVIGRNRVAFYDARYGWTRVSWLMPGDRFDLRTRSLELPVPTTFHIGPEIQVGPERRTVSERAERSPGVTHPQAADSVSRRNRSYR